MGSIVVLMALVFYVFAVMATKLYGEAFPEWFGNLGASLYTLFQVMTLESWSMGIVRPVMDVYPYSWLFFVPFILCTAFTVLNLFIGIIVSAMQEEHEAEADANRQAIHDDTGLILEEVRALRAELKELKAEAARRGRKAARWTGAEASADEPRAIHDLRRRPIAEPWEPGHSVS